VRLALKAAGEHAVSGAGGQAGGGRARADPTPAEARRVHRPGPGQGAARDRAAGGDVARRGARPRLLAGRRGSARHRSPSSFARSSPRHPLCRRPCARAQGNNRRRSSPRSARATCSSSTRSTALSRAAEEILYPALEDFRLDIVVGQGPAARTLTLGPAAVHALGATTRTGLLTTPLRDRFGLTFRLEHYAPDELATIVRRSARSSRRDRGRGTSLEIAGRSRGTPRDREPDPAPRSRRRAGAARGLGHDGDRARGARAARGRRGRARERSDRDLLRAIVDRFDGGPVGLSTLAVALGEEQDTIEDVYEPYLLQPGLEPARLRLRLPSRWCAHRTSDDAAARVRWMKPCWSRYGS